MRRPTVLFINRVYPPDHGATGRMLRDLARGFARDGWEVTVLTTGPRGRKERDGTVLLHRLRAHGRKSMIHYALVWVRLLIAGLRTPRHDLVVSMTDPPMLVVAGSLIARAKKSRHIHWCQDLYPDLLPVVGVSLPEWLMGILTRRGRDAMRRCDRIVVIGRCMARSLTTRGLDPKKISVIPNWPDSELVSGRPAPMPQRIAVDVSALPVNAKPVEEQIRDRIEQKFRVLYAGNLGAAHPVATILDAAEILQHSHPDIQFVFVGDGPRFEELSSERARRGLDNIKLLPWQPPSRLRALMESGDVHLMSMTPDATGLLSPSKIYAALAIARPCVLVGPSTSEAGRLIEDFGAGRVVPQNDANGLAAAISQFRDDPQAWFNAHEGAQRAGELFVPAGSIEIWLEKAAALVALDQPGISLLTGHNRTEAAPPASQNDRAA